MQEVVKKGVGIGVMGIGMLIGIIANRFTFFSLPFWAFLGTGLVLWYIGSFHFVIADDRKHILGNWMIGLVFLLLAPLTFLYAETMQSLAHFNNLPTMRYVVIKVLSSAVFIVSLISLWRNVRQQQKQQKKK